MVSRRRVSPQEVTSRANPAFKAVRSAQVGYGGDVILVEGEKLIEVALGVGLVPLSTWSDGSWPLPMDCPHYQVSADMYTALAPTRSGNAPLVVFEAPKLLSLQADMLVPGRYLLLDRVQEPGNAGALVRAAVAFGMDGILWRKPCVYPFHHAVIRASAACIFQTKHWLMEQLESANLPMIGAAGEEGAIDLDAFQWPAHFILTMGNEGQGLDALLRARLSGRVRIPMAAGVESLNVAGAAHILMYAFSRKGTG